MTPCGNVYVTKASGEPTVFKHISVLPLEGDGTVFTKKLVTSY